MIETNSRLNFKLNIKNVGAIRVSVVVRVAIVSQIYSYILKKAIFVLIYSGVFIG